MLTNELLLKTLENEQERQAKLNEEIRKRAKAIQVVEQKTGIELVKRWFNRYTDIFDVDKKDLPKLRKVVGRMEVVGKSPAYDYDVSKNLDITVKPMKDEFSSLRFRYKKQYLGHGKCKVVTTTYTTSNTQLVCPVK